MGRKSLALSVEEIEKYKGCIMCGMAFKLVNDATKEEYSISKLKGQYESHIASKRHQDVMKMLENIPPTVATTYTNSLEVRVKQLEERIEYLLNRDIKHEQLLIRYHNEIANYRGDTTTCRNSMKSLREDLFGKGRKYGTNHHEMMNYKSFDERLHQLEEVMINPIPEGERTIPTPISVNNHTVVNLVDDTYIPEKITPTTMILTEEERPKPIPMIPESITLDVLKGIKKVEIREQVNEVRHIVNAPYESSDTEYSSDESDDESDEEYEEEKTKDEDEIRMDYQSPYKYEIYGDAYQQFNSFKQIMINKCEENKDALENIYYEVGRIGEWIEEFPLKQFRYQTDREEALRLVKSFDKLYNTLNQFYDNYDDIQWNDRYDAYAYALSKISKTIFNIELINSKTFKFSQ